MGRFVGWRQLGRGLRGQVRRKTGEQVCLDQAGVPLGVGSMQTPGWPRQERMDNMQWLSVRKPAKG